MCTNVIVINVIDYDVILDMDWLSTYNVVIDCQKKHMHFLSLEAKSFEFQGISRGRAVLMISALNTKILLNSGYKGFWQVSSI